MAEALVPVAVVAPVEHRDGARQDPVAVARQQGMDRPALRERSQAGEERHLERRERRPSGGAVGVDGVLEEDELGQRLGSLGPLDRDRHGATRRRQRCCSISSAARLRTSTTRFSACSER